METLIELQVFAPMLNIVTTIMLSQCNAQCHRQYEDYLNQQHDYHRQHLQIMSYHPNPHIHPSARHTTYRVLSDHNTRDLFAINFNDHDGYTHDLAARYGPLDCECTAIKDWPPYCTAFNVVRMYCHHCPPPTFHPIRRPRPAAVTPGDDLLVFTAFLTMTPEQLLFNRPTAISSLHVARLGSHRVTFPFRFLYRLNRDQLTAWTLDQCMTAQRYRFRRLYNKSGVLPHQAPLDFGFSTVRPGCETSPSSSEDSDEE